MKQVLNNEESALSKQVGGNHYKNFPYQPLAFAEVIKMTPCGTNILKCVCRYPTKYGEQDLEKVLHYMELHKEINGVTPLYLYDSLTAVTGFSFEEKQKVNAIFYKFLKENWNHFNGYQMKIILAIESSDFEQITRCTEEEIEKLYKTPSENVPAKSEQP